MNIRNQGACALAALLMLTACGSDPAADAAANAQAAETLNQLQAMANSADGSGLKAVGDLMSDPAVMQQMGSAPPPTAPTAPGAVGPAPVATDPGAAPTIADPSPAADPSQVRALALCRGMKAALTGGHAQMGPEADLKAAAELRANPNALVACQSN